MKYNGYVHEFGGLLLDGQALIFLRYRCCNCGIKLFGADAARMEGMPCPGPRW